MHQNGTVGIMGSVAIHGPVWAMGRTVTRYGGQTVVWQTRELAPVFRTYVLSRRRQKRQAISRLPCAPLRE
jgi:hypothetical protein